MYNNQLHEYIYINPCEQRDPVHLVSLRVLNWVH